MTAHHEPEEPYRGPALSPLARRIHGWSFQGFPIGMGISSVFISLSNLKNHPDFVTKIEIGFFCMAIFFFFLNTTVLFLQFILFRVQFVRLIRDPVRGVFVPLIVLSFATILIGCVNYLVIPGHLTFEFVYVAFWVYVGFAICVCVPMLMVWFNEPHDIKTFTPAWAFLVFPCMLVGIVAINVLRVFPLKDPRAINVLLVGYIFQGLGFFMTFFYLAIYVLRVMTTGFLEGHQANGAFVACGPPGFTALALIKLGEAARTILPEFNLISPMAGEVFYASSVMGALMLLGLALFFFVFGVLPYWWKVHKHLNEVLGAWAVTFPNVGFIVTFRALGDVFQSQVFWTAHAIFTTALVIAFVVIFSLTIYAIIRGEVLNAKEKDLFNDMHPEEREALAKHQSIDFDIVHLGGGKPAEDDHRMHDVDLEKGDGHHGLGQPLEVRYEGQRMPPQPVRPYGNFLIKNPGR